MSQVGRPSTSDHIAEAVRKLMTEKPRRMTAAEIAAEFGLSERTVYRLANGKPEEKPPAPR